jgi:hypothetical protein
MASAPARRPAWSGARDIVLVILGAALAYGADAARDARSERRRAENAMASIYAELQDNLGRVERARARHLAMVDTLRGYEARRTLPPERVYYGGMFAPANVQSAAWETARETGAINGLPYSVLLALAPVYKRQEQYDELSSALAASTMIDIQRRGALLVMRDDFAKVIMLDVDFANREGVLGKEITKALALLDSLRGPRR